MLPKRMAHRARLPVDLPSTAGRKVARHGTGAGLLRCLTRFTMSLMSLQITATYRFSRAESSLPGFFSARRASTDAADALTQWSAKADGRSFAESESDDDQLVASLSFKEDDSQQAGFDLQSLCLALGVFYEPLGT